MDFLHPETHSSGGIVFDLKKFYCSEGKKKIGVCQTLAMGRVGGVVVEIFGVCGVGGSFTAPNGPGRPPQGPLTIGPLM